MPTPLTPTWSQDQFAVPTPIDLMGAVIDSDAAPVAVTQAASTNGSALALGASNLRLALNVTAASGTSPSLTVVVQTSSDGGVNDAWRSVLGTAFTAATAVGEQYSCFAGLDRFVRVVTTISGTTPSFTFTLSGEAV